MSFQATLQSPAQDSQVLVQSMADYMSLEHDSVLVAYSAGSFTVAFSLLTDSFARSGWLYNQVLNLRTASAAEQSGAVGWQTVSVGQPTETSAMVTQSQLPPSLQSGGTSSGSPGGGFLYLYIGIGAGAVVVLGAVVVWYVGGLYTSENSSKFADDGGHFFNRHQRRKKATPLITNYGSTPSVGGAGGRQSHVELGTEVNSV